MTSAMPDLETGSSSSINHPRLLKKSAGSPSCCIFRIPHTLLQANQTAYKPKILSIGPYHHYDGTKEKQHLQMIQEHKQRYLDIFVSNAVENGVTLKHLIEVVSKMEDRIRHSYSEDLDFDREKLTEMMILDGCFILMLFLVVSKKRVQGISGNDPIFKMRWILPIIRSDLLLLENQVPLFLLQNLFDKPNLAPNSTLNKMIFNFFGFSIIRSDGFWDQRENLDALHLLDLIRKTFIPIQPQESKEKTHTNIIRALRESACINIPCCSNNQVQEETTSRPFLNLIVSAKKLRLRGIKFKKKEKFDTPLEITLSKGVLEIPLLVFDDFISSLLINCVALEQFNIKCSTHITSYVTLMGCLISTGDDATLLNEKGIIENYFGTSEEISLFFKNIGKDISFSISKSFLANVFEGVNEYVSKGYHVYWAGFKYTHFNSPWTFMSSIAALMLLILTISQSYFAAYAYLYPQEDK